MSSQAAVLHDYDPALHEQQLERCLHRRLSGSRAARERLVEEWRRGVSLGLVLPGRPPAFLFHRVFAHKTRIDNILCRPEQAAELLDCVLPRLQEGTPIVVCQAAAWARVTGDDPVEQDPHWRRHGFCSLAVEVLETRLPAHRASALPSGYRLTGWRAAYLPLAAQLMERAPDPLQRRVPTHGAECLEIIRAACDLSLGALAWRGERLAGFVTVRPSFGVGQLFVAPPDQGRGVGSALLDRALRQLHERRARRARLTMVEDNLAAWRLYSVRGFRRCAQYPFRYWLAPEYA